MFILLTQLDSSFGLGLPRFMYNQSIIYAEDSNAMALGATSVYDASFCIESDVGKIDFELQAERGDKFLCFT